MLMRKGVERPDVAEREGESEELSSKCGRALLNDHCLIAN